LYRHGLTGFIQKPYKRNVLLKEVMRLGGKKIAPPTMQ